MTTLRDEISAYEAMRSELEANSLGKWALVHDRKLVRVFSDFENAAREAVKKFGRGPYLIRQIGTGPRVLPASIVFGLTNDPNKLRL